ncbi:hypothetical protein ACFL0M_02740 [Thermodesulfobacteriota bacterium]
MDFKNWISQDFMTIVIAGWGAILGTYAAILSTVQLIQRIREKKTRLKVEMTIQVYDVNGKIRGTVSAVAKNKGEREITLFFPSLLYSWSRFRRSGREGLILLNNDTIIYPIDLKPQQSHAQSFDLNHVAEELRKKGYHASKKIRAEYKDALNRTYLSDTFSFDIDRWLRKDDERATEGDSR